MSLDLINVGAEANDGTGDTPRAAFTKTNAAIAVVNDLADAPEPVDYSGAIALLDAAQGAQAGAIAALATDVATLETSQAGQDSAIAQFETTAQLNARDTANRDRANHTGTQMASTITGLAAVATSGAYADLSGKPVAGTLPNNTRINEVEHFYQITKPVVRGDASALAVGDRWWKINDGTEWFWNGTYWLSAEQYAAFWSTTTTFGSQATLNSAEVSDVRSEWPGVFVEYWWVNLINNATTPWDTSNFTTYQVRRNTLGGNAINIGSPFVINDVINNVSGGNPKRVHPINEYIAIQDPSISGGGGLRYFSYSATKTEAATNVLGVVRLNYRGVAP